MRVHCAGFDLLRRRQDTLHPTTRALFASALATDAKPRDVYRDEHLQAEYTRKAAQTFHDFDVLLPPTTTCHPTVAEMEADPLVLNAQLGESTHLADVLDLCAVVLPASHSQGLEGQNLPFGISLFGASGRDGRVFNIAIEFERTS